jgi:hypothetical protein
MSAETLIWTLILFGGTIAVVVWLISIAFRKEAAHLHDGGGSDDAAGPDRAVPPAS